MGPGNFCVSLHSCCFKTLINGCVCGGVIRAYSLGWDQTVEQVHGGPSILRAPDPDISQPVGGLGASSQGTRSRKGKFPPTQRRK